MARYRSTRILPMILIVVIAVIIIVGIVSLIRIIFFSGSNTPPPSQADTSRTALLDTSQGHSVKVTVRGPIVANEAFRSYTIVIDPNLRSLTTYTGYTETVVDNVSLANDTASYEQFVYALDKANLEQGKQLQGDANDLRGRCAVGQVYDFQIIDGGSIVKELWTSTCGGSKGSLTASLPQLLNLFQAQIPNATQTIGKVGLK